MRHLFRAASLATFTLAIVTSAGAQGWKPDRPINIIVPWAAGGSTDQVTRVAAPLLEEALGQPWSS
jgi:tripartite-type tricarboxylate transporter receptor subunit TctC